MRKGEDSLNFYKPLLAFGLAALLGAQAWSDQLYIRNRPFKGYVSGVSQRVDRIQIDLKQLCQALEMDLTEVAGSWYITPKGEAPTPVEGATAGAVYFGEKTLTVVPEGDYRMVNLKEFGDLAGARLSHNKALATVDFNLVGNSTASTSTTKGTPRVAAPMASYRLINFWGSY